MPDALNRDEFPTFPEEDFRERTTLRPGECQVSPPVRESVSDVFEIADASSHARGIAYRLSQKYGERAVQVYQNRIRIVFTDPDNEICNDFYELVKESQLDLSLEEDHFTPNDECFTIFELSLRES
jgi:hypothetical protein